MKQKLSELVKLPEFSRISNPDYNLVCAAYMHRDGDDILVGDRYNKSDPLRDGCMVLPCGHLENRETYEKAILRETREETGIYAGFRNPNMFSFLPDAPFLKEYGPAVIINGKDGKAWIFARDSGRKLKGVAFDLYPLTEPYETESDMRNPRFEQLLSVIRNRESVMPEERFIIDIISEKMGREVEGRIHLDERDFMGFMKESGLL